MTFTNFFFYDMIIKKNWKKKLSLSKRAPFSGIWSSFLEKTVFLFVVQNRILFFLVFVWCYVFLIIIYLLFQLILLLLQSLLLLLLILPKWRLPSISRRINLIRSMMLFLLYCSSFYYSFYCCCLRYYNLFCLLLIPETNLKQYWNDSQ